VANTEKFFRRLGSRLRDLRVERGLSQEDMVLYGFSGKHWQQLESGRPITVTTLLRACETLGVNMETLVRELDHGIYEKGASKATPAVIKNLSARRRQKFSS
jgi:transcriptional regulator with XRE-family HTH domain